MTLAHLESHASVKQWAASAGHHHDPPEVREQRLRILVAFCAKVDKEPDELVAFCILRKKETGERFLSVKRRETINDWLEEFAAEQGMSPQPARAFTWPAARDNPCTRSDSASQVSDLHKRSVRGPARTLRT
jgi:hypothetical protein